MHNVRLIVMFIVFNVVVDFNLLFNEGNLLSFCLDSSWINHTITIILSFNINVNGFYIYYKVK